MTKLQLPGFVLQARHVAAARERRNLRGGQDQLAADAVPARGLHHLLLQSLERHPHLWQGKYSNLPDTVAIVRIMS